MAPELKRAAQQQLKGLNYCYYSWFTRGGPEAPHQWHSLWRFPIQDRAILGDRSGYSLPQVLPIGSPKLQSLWGPPTMLFYMCGAHEGTEHVCRVVDCPAKPGTACKHTPAKCGMCGGPHPATAGNCPAKRATRKELRKRTMESKNGSLPAESLRRTNSVEPAIPSSPGFTFTVVNRDQHQSQPRSSSTPSSPQTQ